MSEIIASSKKAREQMWRELIAEQGQRGQSIRIFCAEHQIRQSTFHYWKRKFKSRYPASLAKKFVPLSSELSSIKAMRTHLRLEQRQFRFSESPRIHLPNGVRIELGSGLESVVVNQFLQKLCGVGYPPKDACPPAVGRGHSAKS